MLASDIDEDSGAAAVWLVQHAGSPDSAQHTLQFERSGGWRYLGAGSGSAREFSLADRPSASVNGPSSMMRMLSSSATRSRADWEKQAGELWVASAGWVACAGFRVATEAEHHGYVVVAWRSPPALIRPLIVAVGRDGSRLSELGPNDHLDSLTRESVQEALLDDPLSGPGRPDTD